MKIKIGNRFIGDGEKCFIIAEAGINHNGDINLAKKLVSIAKNAKVDAIKFQTFTTEDLVTKHTNQREILKNFELSFSDFQSLKEYCDKKDIMFLSTPHSFNAIDFLKDLVPAYKFGSGDITNIPTLKYAARIGKPMILGTGMATLQEVEDAIKAIRSEGNEDIIILHCTSAYPCPLEEVNLRAMVTMQRKFRCIVGYSDHTLGTLVPVMAVAMGAKVIEKHFTLDKNLPGPDHKASLEPHELERMVKEIRDAEKALGLPTKKPTLAEKEITRCVRKSIVAQKEIEKGTVIEKNMLAFKRPGTGLRPTYIDSIIGKKAKRRIAKDELIQLDMVE
jgi:N-acetylneuraminate synthase